MSAATTLLPLKSVYTAFMWQYDVDTDTSLENDERYYFCYDERWRIVATFRNADSDPKEIILHHAAGARGFGSSSYIDSVVFRDKDASTAWGALTNANDILTVGAH